jgi:hypothetical protein
MYLLGMFAFFACFGGVLAVLIMLVRGEFA